MESGDYPQAEADLSKVLKMKPDSPEVHYVIAKLNQARGNILIYRQELCTGVEAESIPTADSPRVCKRPHRQQ